MFVYWFFFIIAIFMLKSNNRLNKDVRWRMREKRGKKKFIWPFYYIIITSIKMTINNNFNSWTWLFLRFFFVFPFCFVYKVCYFVPIFFLFLMTFLTLISRNLFFCFSYVCENVFSFKTFFFYLILYTGKHEHVFSNVFLQSISSLMKMMEKKKFNP